MGTCAHNIFCFGGQVINHKYPKHKEEVEGLEKSNVQRNAIYIYYNKELHRKDNYKQLFLHIFVSETTCSLINPAIIPRSNKHSH